MKKLFLFLAAAFTLCATAFADITVKAKAPSDWTNALGIYSWGALGSSSIVPMTQDGEWYTHTFTGSGSVNIIFVNGTSWTGDANQTVNIENVSADVCYQINEGSGKHTVTALDCGSGEVAPPVENGYSIKHPWGTGQDADWSWQSMTQDGDVYKYTGAWGNKGADVKSADGTYSHYFSESELGNPQVALGAEVTFVFDPVAQTLSLEGMEPGPVDPIAGDGYSIKHPWGTGQDADWSWQSMTQDGDVYKYTGAWGNKGADVASVDGTYSHYFSESELGNPQVALGAEVTFVFDPVAQTLSLEGVEPGPVDPIAGDGYSIKHPWGTGQDADWSWQSMTQDGDVYKYTGAWGNKGADVASVDGTYSHYFSESELGNPQVALGAEVTFVFDPVAQTLSLEGVEPGPVGPGPGPVVGTSSWYLFGYIGFETGATDYSDYDYPFVDGVAAMPATSADSYIFVHRFEDGVEFFTEGWQGAVATVTMVDGRTITTGHDRLLVPAGTPYVYMRENADGTLTVSINPIDGGGGEVNPPTPIGTVYYIKHPWGTGQNEDWAWVQMEANADGTYTCTGAWGGVGANINTVTDDAGADWIEAANIAGAAELVLGDQITFVYNPSTGSLAIASSTGVEQVMLDIHAPLYNILGQPVDASYKGIVIQNGRKYIK